MANGGQTRMKRLEFPYGMSPSIAVGNTHFQRGFLPLAAGPTAKAKEQEHKQVASRPADMLVSDPFLQAANH